MLYTDYTEDLIGLKDIIVTGVNKSSEELHIHIKMKRKPHICPCCQSTTDKIHDYRNQTIKDVPTFANKTYLHLRKRRYICTDCGKRFFESTHFLPRYHRMTSRLIEYVLSKLKSTHSMKSVAVDVNISVPTVCRLLKYLSYKPLQLPKVLSIDEFKGNAGEKYQCIITDPHNRQVIDILKSRELSELSSYFKKFDNRKDVEYFVMDMWKPYKDIAETYFKNAKIVIDKYHFIRQVLWAFDKVRKQEQTKFVKSRRIYFKHSKLMLLKRMHKLKDSSKAAVDVMLRLSSRLSDAYFLKEKFYEFIDSKDIIEAKRKLSDWYKYVGEVNLPEFNDCLKTISNWDKYILNSFLCPYTNGYTEGVNNKIKVLKRNAFGVKNFERFRTRILHSML